MANQCPNYKICVQSSPICYLTQIELPRSSPSCLYFRPNCVNLPKSLRFYKLFS